MTDEDPFAAFKEGQPPVTDPPAAGKTKKARKKKAAKANGEKPPKAAKPAADTPNPPKAGKKQRKPRAPKEVKLPISALLEVGALKPEESGILIQIATGMQKIPKRSRGKIVQALAKIFA